MSHRLFLAVFLLLFSLHPIKGKAEAIDDAFRLCIALENTGLIIECEVNGWGSTVDVRIDTLRSEAKKMCSYIVDMVADYARSIDEEWILRIFSPYSGDYPIARCRFL